MSFFSSMEEAYGVRTVRACAALLDKYSHLCAKVGSSKLVNLTQAKLITRLTQEEKDAIIALHHQGLNTRQIAEKTGRSWTSVKTHVRRMGFTPNHERKPAAKR